MRFLYLCMRYGYVERLKKNGMSISKSLGDGLGELVVAMLGNPAVVLFT